MGKADLKFITVSLPQNLPKHPEHTNYTVKNPNGHNNTKLFIIAIKRLNTKLKYSAFKGSFRTLFFKAVI